MLHFSRLYKKEPLIVKYSVIRSKTKEKKTERRNEIKVPL